MGNCVHFELIVVGAGPAGMASAWSAAETGVKNVLVVDRNAYSGGILPQCIHDGFGIHLYKKPLTGPEYADIWYKKLNDKQSITLMTSTTIVAVNYSKRPFVLTYFNQQAGKGMFTADSIVLAMGCREKTLGQMRIPGSRPAGIYTAGAVQHMMNMQNFLPGRSVVILGSGDIGLIMARRLTLEGAQVKLILGEKASGLARNYVQCVNDYQIPIRFGYTLLSVHGYKRLTGVTVAPLDQSGKADIRQKRYIRCDTLLTATGLIPETELWKTAGHELADNRGVAVNSDGETAVPGVFACGNVTRIYDLVDMVTIDGIRTGTAAARWINRQQGLDIQVTDNSAKEQSVFVEEPRYESIADMADNQHICIACPQGCRLTVSRVNGHDWVVSGHQCNRGKDFGIQEAIEPKRILTTTVKINSASRPLISVKSTKPIARERLRAAVKQLNCLKLESPVTVGQVIYRNILDTGADIVITDGFAEQHTIEKRK